MPFIDPFGASVSQEEFFEHFYGVGFPLSNASKPFESKTGATEKLNNAFLETGIPFRCALEEKPTYFAIVGRSYFTVTAKSGSLRRPSDERVAKVADGKNHW